MAGVEVGARVPRFTLVDQNGEEVSLTDLDGRRLVVYFYPKADTPGCTTQACALRDALADLTGLDAEVIGVSPDDPGRLKKFDDKHRLGFRLLSDPDHTVTDAFGAWGEKKMYGRTYEGVIRSAFVIDERGRVAAAFPKISPKDTVPKVTAALRELEP